MFCNKIQDSAEYKCSDDGNQHRWDDDIAQTAVIIVAYPEGISKHSAGERGGMADNGVNNLEDYIFPYIPEEGTCYFMPGEKLA